MAGKRGFAKTLQGRRHKGASAQEKLRGPNTGAWEKYFTGMKPGALLKYTQAWNSGYDGPGKGTW